MFMVVQGMDNEGQNGDLRDIHNIQRQISVQIIRDKAMVCIYSILVAFPL